MRSLRVYAESEKGIAHPGARAVRLHHVHEPVFAGRQVGGWNEDIDVRAGLLYIAVDRIILRLTEHAALAGGGLTGLFPGVQLVEFEHHRRIGHGIFLRGEVRSHPVKGDHPHRYRCADQAICGPGEF